MDAADLATLAANTLVTAATTDAWNTTHRAFVRLFSHGDRQAAAVRRLDATREQLLTTSAGELDGKRDDLVREWVVRLRDVLDESPELEPRLREAVTEIRQEPSFSLLEDEHSVVAGRDINVRADGGSVAAAMIAGDVNVPGLSGAGSGEPLTGSGIIVAPVPGLVQADHGSIAVGQLLYQPRTTIGRPVSLPPQPMLLAGRDGLLGEIQARMSAADVPKPRVVALFGMGGSGKTSLAIKWAYQQLPVTGIAWQFAAEQPAVLAAGFTRLAQQLGVGVDRFDTRDPVASVHARLSTGKERWLLIFDNALDQESVREFLPPAGDGQILITSQSPYWPAGQALEVPVLDTDAAARFLTVRTGDPDLSAAEDLARELGGLPLALEQAAAYIVATGRTIGSYLTLLRTRRSELLSRGTPSGYGKTIASTWSLALADLEANTPAAVTLLRLLACCAPEPVPIGLLLTPPPGTVNRIPPRIQEMLALLLKDPLAGDDARQGLRKFSLISFSGNDQVLVHRLVQAVTLERMPTVQATMWRQATAALIESAIPADPALPVNWKAFDALLPHAQATLEPDNDGIRRMAIYLQQRGNYTAARDLWGVIAQTSERHLGPDSHRTLIARAKYAELTAEAGNPRTARDDLIALVPKMELTLGPEHRDTLAAHVYLADATGDSGNSAAARDHLANVVPVIGQVAGPEHPDTLAARFLLAHHTGFADGPVAARDMFAALVPIYERTYGSGHPETIKVRVNFAGWTGNSGNSAGARDQYRALLPIREHMLGPEHPMTLNVRGFLAGWTGKAGEPVAARDMFAALVPVMERVLGAEHPDTLFARRRLAEWTGIAGEPVAARDMFAAVVPVMERVLGAGHPATISVHRSQADWARKARNRERRAE